MSKFAVDRPMVALLAVWLACNIFTPVKKTHIENPNCHLLTTSPSLRGAEGPPELRSRSSASLIALPGPPRADPASCLQITKKVRYRCFKMEIRHSVTSFSQMWEPRVDGLNQLYYHTIKTHAVEMGVPESWEIYLTASWRPWKVIPQTKRDNYEGVPSGGFHTGCGGRSPN